MSVSWTFLTKSFMPLRYRDIIAAIVITKYTGTQFLDWIAKSMDSADIMTRVYTHDESDIEFREPHNMVDSAVRRTKTIEFAKRIREERAKKERELMLDAFNYLNKKNH